MLLQELWLPKIGWDDLLPSQILTRWLTIREEFTQLARLSIPRWFITWSDSTVELHGFSDASQLAITAVIYIITNSPSTRPTSAFVCSKTKIAPLKRLTISRLKLTATLLLARLIKYVQATLNVNVASSHM
ncbi:uncharacterized protein [Cardiocondyla obscurior]|uniref:uncharacterized protein n=1 Tax=Cardiocondyla obscurior TaxID=286306 RepID=UPI0039658556